MPASGKSTADASLSPGADAIERVAVVLNCNARGVTPKLVEKLGQAVPSGDLFVSRSLEEGREIARIIVERGYSTVYTGGGDGTFVRMVSWIMALSESTSRTPPRIGLLKLGTGNALAWAVGAQNHGHRSAVPEPGQLKGEGRTRAISLIEVEDLLTPFAGLGADAIALDHYLRVSEAMGRSALLRPFSTGITAYTIAILGRTVPEFALKPPLRVTVINQGRPAVLVGPDGEPAGTPVASGQVIYQGPARLLAISTIPYWGFGARIFPHAEKEPGRFNLRIASFGAMVVFANMRAIWRGSFRHRLMQDFLVDAISIRCEEPSPLQVGGDVLGRRTEVLAKLSERSVRVVDYRNPTPEPTTGALIS